MELTQTLMSTSHYMERKETRDSENWTLNIFQEESKYSFISCTSKLLPRRQISHIILWGFFSEGRNFEDARALEVRVFLAHFARLIKVTKKLTPATQGWA